MQLGYLFKTNDYWEERANKVLSNFKYSYPDEIDMYDICWRYGIQIKPLDAPFVNELDYESIKHLKAYSVPIPQAKRGTIYIKPGLDAIEKKLLLAEEFCHLYSHYQSQLSVSPFEVAKAENQAKRMAAYLLVPVRFLNDIYRVAIDGPVLVSDIADYFVVTEEFAHYRLKLIYNRKVDAILSLKNSLGTFEWL